MLCSTCSAIPLTVPSQDKWRVKHHQTFAQLDASAQAECRLCAVFKSVALQYTAHELSCSIDEAERQHRLWDAPSDLQVGVTSPEEDSFRRGFTVESLLWSVASDSGPDHNGVQALSYKRWVTDPTHPHFGLLGGYVHVSSLPRMDRLSPKYRRPC